MLSMIIRVKLIRLGFLFAGVVFPIIELCAHCLDGKGNLAIKRDNLVCSVDQKSCRECVVRFLSHFLVLHFRALRCVDSDYFTYMKGKEMYPLEHFLQC
mmetsp:Transcript_17791/g.21929  ORF Transcript_17791/g.21929 Transcript_17791/m.21929 type:complete len:99 (+) Transcript_17791:209-505(+)